jgi:transposase
MYIERVPNRNSPPAILLRESYREGKRVRKRTLANLSHWPEPLIENVRVLLRGGSAVGTFAEAFEVVRSRPHGHVAAVLGTLRRLGLERVIAPEPTRERDLVIAMVVARVIEPRSKLATARGLNTDTLHHSLAEELGLEDADEDRLYGAMDWLLARQQDIEATLAARHLENGALVLYDVTSSYFEDRACSLARLGHARDGKKGKLQIVFGLLCNRDGCPVAVFAGNTGDPSTLGTQIETLRTRFALSRVVLVGDRGMLTDARLREEIKPIDGLEWISALRAPAIRQLIDAGALQRSLFDRQHLPEITSPDYPGERLIVCKNPLLAEERARKREDLLQATEHELDKIVAATKRPQRRLQGKDKIALRIGRVIAKFKVAKHFALDITDEAFAYRRNAQRIAEEAALDGLDVIRTSVFAHALNGEQTVRAYKGLSVLEQAFRSYKTPDLKVRPIYHYLAERVCAHVFLCMLAYYVEWHMRDALAPMLFDDEDRAGGEARRASIVAPAKPSASAEHKARTKRTLDGQPVHSFQTLLADLATIVKNRIHPKIPGAEPFDQTTRPTPLQEQALTQLRRSDC